MGQALDRLDPPIRARSKDTSTRLLTQYDGWDNARVAAMYNVSEQFAQMQMTGQRVRANGQRKRGSSS